MFPSRSGAKCPHLSELKSTFNKILRDAKIKELRFHDLRRTDGSILLNADVPLEVISKPLGHIDVRVIERVYAHLNDKTLRNAAMIFEKEIGQKAGRIEN